MGSPTSSPKTAPRRRCGWRGNRFVRPFLLSENVRVSEPPLRRLDDDPHASADAVGVEREECPVSWTAAGSSARRVR